MKLLYPLIILFAFSFGQQYSKIYTNEGNMYVAKIISEDENSYQLELQGGSIILINKKDVKVLELIPISKYTFGCGFGNIYGGGFGLNLVSRVSDNVSVITGYGFTDGNFDKKDFMIGAKYLLRKKYNIFRPHIGFGYSSVGSTQFNHISGMSKKVETKGLYCSLGFQVMLGTKRNIGVDLNLNYTLSSKYIKPEPFGDYEYELWEKPSLLNLSLGFRYGI